jgi:hypothetical protein
MESTMESTKELYLAPNGLMVTLATLAVVGLASRDGIGERSFPSTRPSLFVGLASSSRASNTLDEW